ncbi:cilia- and flagella-associated protein 58-like [Microplitis mediator]|uniref:cilia- and flagella-associated protein 58-like n=1 Tax=Microplitis mediator TaxID=375433 RepID=UPI0025563C4B|nr:cilia- and flagella-associated protein 58-like [Microplitis mediator]
MDMEMNAEMEREDGSESGEPSAAGSSAGSIYCTLERDYARLLNEMKNNETLAAYETEYTRLFETLYKCRRDEEQLMDNLRQVQEDLVNKTNRINELEKAVEQNECTITNLNEKIVEVSKLADTAHTREQNAQETIENLRIAINKLNREIEQRNKKLDIDDDGEVAKQNENSVIEKERMTNEIETLKQSIKSKSMYTEELEKKMSDVENQISKMQENMEIQMNEISKERLVRERLEREIMELEEELKIKTNQLQAANISVKNSANNSSRVENLLREQRAANEKLRKEVSKLMTGRLNLQTELNNSNKRVKEIEKILGEKTNEYKVATQEIKRLEEEVSKCKAENDWSLSKYGKIDRERAKMEKDLEHVKVALKNSEIHLSSYQRQIAEEKKSVDLAVREKNVVIKNLENLKDTLEKTHTEISVLEGSKRKVEGELEEALHTNCSLNKKIDSLEKDREKYCQQVTQLQHQIEELMSKLKEKDTEVLNYSKELVELKNKFRHQQNLFESTRAEKNMCNKNLSVKKDEIEELRDKLKLMVHQIEQLKEELAIKESSISKGEFCLRKAEKEKESVRVELQSAKKNIMDLRKTLEENKIKEKQLREGVKVADADISRLKKDIDNVMNERDVLGTQLVRRNDELNLQYSKIKLLHQTLRKGEAEYSQRLEDIRLLKLEISKLRSEKVLLVKSFNNTSDLRHEILHLNRDMTRERLKVVALEEELQNPLNIHRWRKLEGSDPNTMELLKKIQILQKRLLKMNQIVISKTNKIKEIEKLYMELRQILAKQPALQSISNLVKAREALRERAKQMKCLTAELNMWECRANEYKYEVERLSKELRELRAKYLGLKRKKSSKPSSGTAMTDSPRSSASPNHKKYCGGGFTMLVAPSQNYYSLESIIAK